MEHVRSGWWERGFADPGGRRQALALRLILDPLLGLRDQSATGASGALNRWLAFALCVVGCMIVTDYRSVEAKLARAVELLEDLEAERTRWFGSNPLRMVPKPTGDGRSEDLYMEVLVPMPLTLNALLGDCVHNFRSTLDHLAMTLAIDNGADPYDFSIQFPICDSPEAFFGKVSPKTGALPGSPPRGTGRYQIRALHPDAQRFIESLQPYRRTGTSWTLTELHHLDNRDKHRSLLELSPEAIATFHPAPGTTVTYIDPFRLREGERFGTITFPAGFSGPKQYPPIPVGIGVEHSNRVGWLDVPGFPRGQLLRHVREIVDEAERLFP